MINRANIRIGSACLIQDRVYLRAGVDGSIEIGDGAALNSFVQIYGHGGVKIGAATQIGANCTILPGVTIGDKAVIGVPARVVRHFDNGRAEQGTDGAIEVQTVEHSKKIINR